MEFRNWLLAEMKQRDLIAVRLAERAGIDPGTLSRILDDENPRPVGPNVARKIAQALNEPVDKVFQIAGLLPVAPGEGDPVVDNITDLAKLLPQSQRQEVLDFIRFKVTTVA